MYGHGHIILTGNLHINYLFTKEEAYRKNQSTQMDHHIQSCDINNQLYNYILVEFSV